MNVILFCLYVFAISSAYCCKLHFSIECYKKKCKKKYRYIYGNMERKSTFFILIYIYISAKLANGVGENYLLA